MSLNEDSPASDPDPELRSSASAESDEPSKSGTRRGKIACIISGGILGLLSTVLAPIILGPISFLCGVQLYRKHSKIWGILIMGWAFVLGGIGFLLTLSAFASMA